MKPKRLICVAGARPNFMKLAPLLRVLNQDPELQPILVHTGQHYDDAMSGRFFRDLGIPEPDYHLQVGSGTHAEQTAEILKRAEPVFLKENPDGVIVVGDVNSTMACALVAKKLSKDVIHVEAGLRSFDRSMPEEINRIVTDSISDLFLVTEESGRQNLLREGAAADRIHLVGNLMIDSLRSNLARAQESDIFSRLGLPDTRYGVVTLHRPANVDTGEQLGEILDALSEISQTLPLYFPVHPRTRERLSHFSVPGSIRLVEPLGYLDFLCLLSKSSAVFTDSGGIQEETTVLGIPCFTLRNNTERPVTIEHGTNVLAGTEKVTILRAWGGQNGASNGTSHRTPPLWDGSAAERCRCVLRQHYGLPRQESVPVPSLEAHKCVA